MSRFRPVSGMRAACRRGWCRVAASLLLVSQSGLVVAAAPVGLQESYFIAPVTGQKVTHYDISLPTTEDPRRAFQVPRDCAELTALIRRRKADRSRVVDRRLWLKVENDCRYHAVLHRHESRGIADYVTGYDFRNLALDILPYESGCADDDPTRCGSWLTDANGQRLRFPLTSTPGASQETSAMGTACKLEDGLFRGRVVFGVDGLSCVPDDRASLRLVGVDYGDVNGDGILDAVLRLIPISPEGGRRLLRVPVTRLSPGGPFEVPRPADELRQESAP